MISLTQFGSEEDQNSKKEEESKKEKRLLLDLVFKFPDIEVPKLNITFPSIEEGKRLKKLRDQELSSSLQIQEYDRKSTRKKPRGLFD
jgi:hypothetical protein